jgi:hypothetical protein
MCRNSKFGFTEFFKMNVCGCVANDASAPPKLKVGPGAEGRLGLGVMPSRVALSHAKNRIHLLLDPCQGLRPSCSGTTSDISKSGSRTTRLIQPSVKSFVRNSIEAVCKRVNWPLFLLDPAYGRMDFDQGN